MRPRLSLCGPSGLASTRLPSIRLASYLLALLVTVTVAAQSPAPAAAPDPAARRVTDRIRSLQRESERLAGEARTLVGDLRKLEVDRDLRSEEAKRADDAVADAQRSLAQTTERLTTLEQQRVSQLPDVKAQLVDVYKRGRAGNVLLLLGAGDVREFARAARAVSALAARNERRIAEHRRTVDAVRQERMAAEEKSRTLQATQADARRARTAADRAVAARAALMADIDARRDLTAQYVGELQMAYDGLQQRVAELAAGRAGTAVSVPLTPFRGALDWPAAGGVAIRFGQTANRSGGAAVRNGIEIGAAEGSPVRAIHGGTVGYADAFAGFGNLVIVDHGGNNFSLYGYLGSTLVARGDIVEEGSEVGTVGASPGGPSALYFEMRIDGRSVDPGQWLEPR